MAKHGKINLCSVDADIVVSKFLPRAFPREWEGLKEVALGSLGATQPPQSSWITELWDYLRQVRQSS